MECTRRRKRRRKRRRRFRLPALRPVCHGPPLLPVRGVAVAAAVLLRLVINLSCRPRRRLRRTVTCGSALLSTTQLQVGHIPTATDTNMATTATLRQGEAKPEA
jgi:hypothetical protein